MFKIIALTQFLLFKKKKRFRSFLAQYNSEKTGPCINLQQVTITVMASSLLFTGLQKKGGEKEDFSFSSFSHNYVHWNKNSSTHYSGLIDFRVLQGPQPQENP